MRERMGRLSKKEKGLLDMDNRVVVAGRKGGIRGLNCNGNYIIKIKFKKRKKSFKGNLWRIPKLFLH